MADPAESSGQERRQHKRLSDVFMVAYRLKTPLDVVMISDGKELAAVAMDISEGGLGIDALQGLAVGSKVRMKFRLINEVAVSSKHLERSFTLDGECRYCEMSPKQSYRAGILFKNATDEDRGFIAVYIKDQTLAQMGR